MRALSFRAAQSIKALAVPLSVVCIQLALAPSVTAGPVVRSASGADAAAILGTVNVYRNDLGNPNNANTPGPLPSGRREINWDGAGPNVAANPVTFGTPMTTFQNRGAIFTTPGTGFQISGSDGVQGVVGLNEEFGNINPTYPASFTFFSEPKLFTALDSNIVDVRFFIPAVPAITPAGVSGFGAVFTDVDLANTTSLEFFDVSDSSLGLFFAPTADNGLSFLGVSFDAGEQVARVRITNGNVALGAGTNDANGNPDDVVAMDDFIYAEPQLLRIPEPGTVFLMAIGFLALMGTAFRSQENA